MSMKDTFPRFKSKLRTDDLFRFRYRGEWNVVRLVVSSKINIYLVGCHEQLAIANAQTLVHMDHIARQHDLRVIIDDPETPFDIPDVDLVLLDLQSLLKRPLDMGDDLPF